MEFLEGETLALLIKRAGPAPLSEALEITGTVYQWCSGRSDQNLSKPATQPTWIAFCGTQG